MTDFSSLTLTAIHAALQAGEMLAKRFGGVLDICSKEGTHNFVSDADVAAETIIINQIRSQFPSHSILSEECGTMDGSEILWIIDPIDGTLNFIRSVPLFAISIGVAVAGELVSGVIYLPIMRELFVAQKGRGAFLNGTRLKVSGVESLDRSVLVSGAPYHSQQKKYRSVEQYAKMLSLGCPIRDLGSAAIDLAYVASGRYDGYWMPSIKPWDVAAAKVLIEEAGGLFTKYDGAPYCDFVEAPIIASNGLLHPALLQQF